MREELDVRWVLFPFESAFPFRKIRMKEVFPIGTLTWLVSNHVSHQRKGIEKRDETTKAERTIVLFLRFVIVFFENLTVAYFPTTTK